MRRWLSAIAALSLTFVGVSAAHAQDADDAKTQAVASCVKLYSPAGYGRIFNNCGATGWVYRAKIEYRNAGTGRTYTAVGPYVGHYNYSNTGNVSPNPITRRTYQGVQAE